MHRQRAFLYSVEYASFRVPYIIYIWNHHWLLRVCQLCLFWSSAFQASTSKMPPPDILWKLSSYFIHAGSLHPPHNAECLNTCWPTCYKFSSSTILSVHWTGWIIYLNIITAHTSSQLKPVKASESHWKFQSQQTRRTNMKLSSCTRSYAIGVWVKQMRYDQTRFITQFCHGSRIECVRVSVW